MAKKIGILRILSKDSDVMILDEPTSALEQESQYAVWRLLKEIKKKDNQINFISILGKFWNRCTFSS